MGEIGREGRDWGEMSTGEREEDERGEGSKRIGGMESKMES